MNARGFSLIELGIVLVLFGLVLAFVAPAIRHSTSSSALRAGADGLAAQVSLAREKAVDTGQDLILRFAEDSLNSDFHVRDAQGGVSGQWSLPAGISYAPGSPHGFTITRDGRASASCYLVLVDHEAQLETLSVQRSGLVIVP